MMDIVRRTPLAEAVTLIAEEENLRKDFEEFLQRSRSVKADGRACADTSLLVSTMKKASEADSARVRGPKDIIEKVV